MRAVEAASDALYTQASGGSGTRGRVSEEDQSEKAPEPAQLRADAVGLLAERALATGFGGGAGGKAGCESADTAPVSGSRAERYQVVLHVEAATLTERGEPGLCELEDGTRVSAETARRLACDASRLEVHRDGVGSAARSIDNSAVSSAKGSAHGSTHRSVLDVGRRTRTIPPALRRALDARDRGCRFPACGLRFTDAHHIVHWADGGETKLENTVLLCRRHHRRVHEGGYRVCSDRNGQVVFFTPKGHALFEAPPLPELPPDPVQALVRGNRQRGITPDFSTGAPKWSRDSYIPWAIEAAAIEALDPCDEPSVRESPVAECPVHQPPNYEPSVHESSVLEPAAYPSSPTPVSAETA